MAPRRWLLLFVSLASLVLLSYAAVTIALSVPVSDAMAAANTIPGEGGPRAGSRAVVEPVSRPDAVGTHARGSEGPFGRPGDLLVVAERSATIPASLRDPALVRALAYASRLHDGTYAPAQVWLENVTSHVNGTIVRETREVNVSELAAGREGFLVKADAEPDIRFVPLSQVQGRVERFDSPATTVLMMTSGVVGFVAPLVALVLTHRGAGRRGDVVTLTGVCPECRSAVAPEVPFCPRCGAWLRKSS